MNPVSRQIWPLMVLSILCACTIVINPSMISAFDTISLGQHEEAFARKITNLAEWFIGVPYELGGDAKTTSTIDNSHLLCLIYEESAKKAGFQFRGYMPMKNLLEHTTAIDPHEIKVGDLIVLQDDHAALIYKFESDSKFHMTYASEKRQEVISFNSHNVVYDAYWLKNLKGFYRLNDYMLRSKD